MVSLTNFSSKCFSHLFVSHFPQFFLPSPPTYPIPVNCFPRPLTVLWSYQMTHPLCFLLPKGWRKQNFHSSKWSKVLLKLDTVPSVTNWQPFWKLLRYIILNVNTRHRCMCSHESNSFPLQEALFCPFQLSSTPATFRITKYSTVTQRVTLKPPSNFTFKFNNFFLYVMSRLTYKVIKGR